MNDPASDVSQMDTSKLGDALVAAASEPQGGAGALGGGAGGAAPAKKPTQSGPVQSLDFVLDIPLRVTAELGRTKMSIREVLELGQGSVIELSKLAGEPLEVLVNDKLVARGEVVVVNEKFGIRLTDIISPIERIEQLK
jgi:flagellar motor switch protein FliN/FliY